MVTHRIVERPEFDVVGKQTWIAGPDNESFGRFWQQCQDDGTLDLLRRISGNMPGTQTGGMVIGVEALSGYDAEEADGLERCHVETGQWAVFDGSGVMPLSLVHAEMHAFMEWLPASSYVHALAPEMEVYPPGTANAPGEVLCEFWLPLKEKK